MGLFDVFKKSAPPSVEVVDEALRRQLMQFILKAVTSEDNRIRVEDALNTAATIVAERCIDTAGDYPLREHDLTPGSRVLSTAVNRLVCGDVADGGVGSVPRNTIIGILRARLDPALFLDSEFPALRDVFSYYAAHVGNAADWGKVPLSVDPNHHPFVPPLRIGYETRRTVDEILKPATSDKMRCLRIATESLADILKMVAGAIDHKLALTLTIETINGMAKTAPMTEKAMKAAAQQQDGKKDP
ncbi:MAG: hypothetical protein K1X78_25500 [Verrucomicrobiaceae bacterium]|nr:hypothetical protein [Verrucomicrobiaceae bacterium]